MIPYTITPKGISVLINNRPRIISTDHMNYQACFDALKAGDIDALATLADIPAWVASITYGKVAIGEDMTVRFDGVPMHNTMTERLISMLRQGLNPEPIAKFMERLFLNPVPTAHGELYTWLEKGNMPITDDGCFIAYKRVNADYTSCHDHKTPNHVGTMVSMERRDLADSDFRQQCSTGLHFCSYEYLSHFGGSRTLVLKVAPEDVVAIPDDHGNTKGRAWRYEVIGEVPSSERIADFRVKAVVTEDDKFEHDKDKWSTPPKSVKKAPSMSGNVTVAPKDRFALPDGKILTAKQLLKKIGTKSINEAARQFGVARSTLQGWVKKAKG